MSVQYVGWCTSTRCFETWFTTRRYSVWHSCLTGIAADTAFIMGGMVKKIHCYEGLQAVPARPSAKGT
jgi:hypothetical protein